MNNVLVFDAWAWLAWVQNEKVAVDVVRHLLEQAESREITIYTSIVNVGEVYYRLMKSKDKSRAKDWKDKLPYLPIQVVGVTDAQVWAAADLKALAPISYADAFAAALTFTVKGKLVTGDDDFYKLPEVDIYWLGLTRTT